MIVIAGLGLLGSLLMKEVAMNTVVDANYALKDEKRTGSNVEV